MWVTERNYFFNKRGCCGKYAGLPCSNTYNHFICLPVSSFDFSFSAWGKNAHLYVYFLCNNYNGSLYLQNNQPNYFLMEQNQQKDYLSQSNQQILPALPNSTAVLVLGILSIVVCFITGIIALVMAKKDLDLYNANPGTYSASSYSNIKTGRICAIIGIIIQGLGLIAYIIFVAVLVGTIGKEGFK